MLKRLLNPLTSLRLTIVCLGMAVILVFVGTLAEVKMGLYQAQAEIFRSFIVYWTPEGAHTRIPVFPGGWLIGLVLLVNLLAAHIKRFRFERKKTGILLIHGGLIFLLVGQFITEIFQIESTMRLPVGGTRNYTEDSRKIELAVADVTDPSHDSVVAIPQALLVPGGEIHPPGLPFTLRVKNYFQNSRLTFPMDEGAKLQATHGTGQRLLLGAAPVVKTMDDEDKAAALVEVLANNVSLGDWTVSLWFSKEHWIDVMYDDMTNVEQKLGVKFGVLPGEIQGFALAGHTYNLSLRPVRYYKPYSITLLEFKHDTYAGTGIPSNFSSKIHLSDPARGEDRDVLIKMNAPLRYGGETFYQASFEPGDQVSILQVVRNPAAITPYVACSLVALGLIVQFLTHLFGFARRQAQKLKNVASPASAPKKVLQPALAEKGIDL